MANKILSGFVLLLMIIAAASGFDYTESQSKSTILDSMNETISEIVSNSYNAGRFQDIYDEALLSEGDSLYYAASIFKNTSLLYEESREKLINYRQQLEHISANQSIISQLEAAEVSIRQARYESALSELETVSAFLAERSEARYEDMKAALAQLEIEFSRLNKTTEVLSIFGSSLKYAESRNDIIELDILDSELDMINESVRELILTEGYLDHFSKKHLSGEQLNDYYGEMLFNFEKNRYERISALHEEAKTLYDSASEYENKYDEAASRLSDFQEEDKIEELRAGLYGSYSYYEDADFENALCMIDSTAERILEYESAQLMNLQKKKTISDYAEEYWKELLIIAGISIVLLLFAGKSTRLYFVRKRIKYLKNQKSAVISLIKKSQVEYYDKKTIPKKLYAQKSVLYQKKLVRITRELALLQSETKN